MLHLKANLCMFHKKAPLLVCLMAVTPLAHALYECGVVTPLVTTFTCTNAAYASGIDYYQTAVNQVDLSNPSMVVSVNGVHAGPRDVSALNTLVNAQQFSQINTTATGVKGRGLMATTRGNATVVARGGEISTLGGESGGNTAIGVLAEVFGPGAGIAVVTITDTKITTQGDGANGVMAYTGFGGVVTGGAEITATNANIVTHGAGSVGLMAAAFSVATPPVTITSSSNVTANGINSLGVYAYSGGGAVQIKLPSGLVHVTGSGSDGVSVNAPATAVPAVITHGGQITSDQGDGIDLTLALSGSIITSTGDITGALAAVRGSPAADSLTAAAGALNGLTLMEAGDDLVTLSGTVNVTNAAQFDGGAGVNRLTIDGLSMRGFTGANNLANGSALTLWETISLTNSANLKLTGNLFEGGAGAQQLNITGATLDASGSPSGTFAVNGNVANSGTLTMDDAPAAADDTTTITGNYVGAAGVVVLNTALGNSASPSDLLVIKGNSSGTSTLRVSNAGGLGAATTGDGILVVQVDGTSDASFVLDGGAITAGQFSYTLHKVGNNWFLQSAAVPVVVDPVVATMPVPTLGTIGMLALSALMGLFAWSRRRRA